MSRFSRWFTIILVILPVGPLLIFLDRFIYLGGSKFSDLVISHLPNVLWIQRSWREWGQIPFWSNTILSGYPFAANPLSGLHYPPGWLIIFLPQPFGLNLMMVLHLALGGAGIYRFLRGEGLDRSPAILGMFGFESMPKLWAHLGAGHVTLIYAVSWTPWLLLAERSSSGKRWLPAVVLGVMALADPRWAALAGFLWLAYSLCIAYRGRHPSGAGWMTGWAVRAFGCAIAAGCLSAVLLLPLSEYIQLSTRATLTPKDVTELSLPPAQLLGFLGPLDAGQEWILYPGGVIVALALSGLGIPGGRKKAIFWYGVASVSILYAMIGYLPGGEFVAHIPGLNMLRVPSRAMFAGELALIIVACQSFQAIMREPTILMRPGKLNPFLILLGLDFFMLLLAGAGWIVMGRFQWRFAWGAVALAGALGFLFLARDRRLSPTVYSICALTWLWFDLSGSNLLALQSYSTRDIMEENDLAAENIQTLVKGSLVRVYSPSYSLPQQTAAVRGLELADGVDPLQLRGYVEYMHRASGVSSDRYSVTLPAFGNGDPAVANRDSLPDARMLGYLNVGYVTSEFPLNVDGLVEITRIGATFIYRDVYVRPRAWVQVQATNAEEDHILPAQVTWTPNRIQISAHGPGRLVLDELTYPGWEALLDGKQVPIQSEDILRAVDLPAGDHKVEFVYVPVMLIIGGCLSGLSWLSALILWGRRSKRRS